MLEPAEPELTDPDPEQNLFDGSVVEIQGFHIVLRLLFKGFLIRGKGGHTNSPLQAKAYICSLNSLKTYMGGGSRKEIIIIES